MKVYKLTTNSPLKNFNYFVEVSANEVIVVDPLYENQISDWLSKNSKKLVAIFLTHFHSDHVQAAKEVKEKFRIPCHAGEHFLGDKNLVDIWNKDNETLTFKNGKIKLLYTPGHTDDHICLLIFDTKGKMSSIIAMDTLFNAGVGNCKGGGNVEVLYETIMTLKTLLNDDVVLYPGHDYIENNLAFTLHHSPKNQDAKNLLTKIKNKEWIEETTIGLEKKISLFFLAQNKEEFIKLRSLRDNW